MGPPAKAPEGDAKAKVKVRVGLNLHGIVGVQSVQQIEEEEYEETVPKQAAPAKVRLHQDRFWKSICTGTDQPSTIGLTKGSHRLCSNWSAYVWPMLQQSGLSPCSDARSLRHSMPLIWVHQCAHSPNEDCRTYILISRLRTWAHECPWC